MLNRSIRTSQRGFRRDRSPAAARYSVIALAALAISFAVLAAGCAPEVGSKAWCTQMKETPKGDWSTNEAVDFAKHCLFE